ncbi:MAG: phosphopyruvate hydratase [Cytophagales bacterium]|nr:phosphopyruvate hydratase [Cytophagales bacterium]
MFLGEKNRIRKLITREIIDSRGLPTLEVEIYTANNICGKASVPSGASTGKHEVLEKRDTDSKRYMGKGVKEVAQKITQEIFPLIKGESVLEQRHLDERIRKEEGSENLSRWGGNATLAVSLALARAGAQTLNMPLYEYLQRKYNFSHSMPRPMMNILNGGRHADNILDIQEFMILPLSTNVFSEALRMGVEIFHSLKNILKRLNYATNVGDEGGFAPNLDSHEKAIEILIKAIEEAHYIPGKDVAMALDIAASEFYNQETRKYHLKTSKKPLSSDELIEKWTEYVNKYPILSLEDALAEDDWIGWKNLTNRLNHKVQLVGDDLFVTSEKRFLRGIKEGVANAILIKPNQVGNLSETIKVIHVAQKKNYEFIVSHRSGETEDSFIADLAVAAGGGQIKTGAPCRSDRTAKYNQLLRIESNTTNQNMKTLAFPKPNPNT